MNKCIVIFLFFLCGLSYAQSIYAQNVYTQKVYAQNRPTEKQRIIALSPHAVEILYAIGAGDRIIGTLTQADYPPDALNIPRIGDYQRLQIEKVLALKPDLIIAWKTGNKSDDLERLKSFGLPIYFSQPKTINDIFDDIKNIGRLTHLEKSAQKVIHKLEQQYQQLKINYANKTKVRIFYQIWHSPLRTIGGNSWIDLLIKDCGGINIFNEIKKPYPIISLESVLLKEPQMIIVPKDGGWANNTSDNWKRWPMIPAVKNKHIKTIDADLLHRQGPRAIEGLQQLCQLIDSARKRINP